MNDIALINRGLIWRGYHEVHVEPTERTIIATGLGRSGTSMIAALLAELGILSTEHAYPATLDDREFLHLLKFRKTGDFRDAIAARNHLGPV
ncbi:MAG TPA: hypothetical protein VLI93_01965 [Acetobacteraceae bacterium]|nr:hypothetical protein [Acetobacteraceae bacterium]